MEPSVECTHCKVVMTSWSAPGSPIRYYQCPFCARTHSSLYGEVFRRRAGARVLDGAPAPATASRASGIPMASPEDIRWAGVKQTAARWFARLEADQRRNGGGARPARPPRVAHAPRAPIADDVPEIDPDEVIEIAAPRRARGR
ncbi:hypothetical protein [Anaeromyxobacter oryzae]|uniref:Uncharacterized protein n=1 Tax=Anaeromyxobacter oryzae TaxID=2918170 RepID=A0ABM7X2J4_9BACT|nr:hypothetical protein [Anaeromyxobacter oryzae]BDG06002.1 hypothetical protein AMOR_49980 [Anaeromyxobacter oryzae]